MINLKLLLRPTELLIFLIICIFHSEFEDEFILLHVTSQFLGKDLPFCHFQRFTLGHMLFIVSIDKQLLKQIRVKWYCSSIYHIEITCP